MFASWFRGLVADWWTRPRLRRDEDEAGERKVGFIDLFYDLIFVVAVAQVAHGLAKHPDREGLITFALLFVPVWWVWIGNTFYTDRFETNDVSHRLMTFLQMLPVVGMAVFIHDARGHTVAPFVFSYLAGRLLIIALWLRAGWHNREARGATNGYGIGFGIGALLWLVSLHFDDPVRSWLWIAGIAVDLLTPMMMRKQLAHLPKFSKSRLTERFGLFTIIVLGESVAGTVLGLAEIEHLAGVHMAIAGLAMALAFALFWIYFEMVPRENLKPGFFPVLFRSYLHLPLLAAIAATGAGVLGVVGHEGEVLAEGPRRVLAWSITVAALCLLGLSRVHQYQVHFRAAQRRTELSLLIAIAVSFWIGYAGSGFGAVRTLAILLGVLMVLIIWGIVAWARQKMPADD